MSPHAVQSKYSIATMGADGIGPEVVDASVQVMKKLVELDGSFELAFENFDWSSDTYKKTGKYIPDGGLDELRKHDAILFGAVGAPGEFDPVGIKLFQLTIDRRTRSHLSLGPTISNLPAIPAIRQRASHKDFPRYVIAAAES